MIHDDRVQVLAHKEIRRSNYVLYWMQNTQRIEFNHALEYAIIRANKIHNPVVVYFGLTRNFPEANNRHYYFMLEGLQEVHRCLEERGIQMIILNRSPETGAVELSTSASLVVVDRGYLQIQRKWRNHVAQSINCPLIQVESDVIVPVEIASPKEEYSAATFRPKITKHLQTYLTPLQETNPVVDQFDCDWPSINIDDIEKVISDLKVDRSVESVPTFQGGTTEAKKHLENFLNNKLHTYPDLRNDPSKDSLSNMSPYLHFGQISPLYIASRVLETESTGRDAYLEELLVRRELSVNFVFYNPNYNSFDGLPKWAKTTLVEHSRDPRDDIYTRQDLEQAETHDPYWNAAQEEMTLTGKMHGYMRMYWGKKIIEWSKTPQEAYKIALYLNNKYELDGRDPNSYAGVAWCFGKHDRPWKERPIFGKVRFMNATGLKRKFDADSYVEMISQLSS